MGSHGGVISAERGAASRSRWSIRPGRRLHRRCRLGRLLGIDNVVAFDMGGTTAKCALIERGSYAVESTYHVGGPQPAFRFAAMSSISSRSAPAAARSPGSMPAAPQRRAAQRRLDAGAGVLWRGGLEPTVTDANLLLGRLDPDNFLGGEMPLAVAARDAMMQQSPSRLAMAADAAIHAAKGVLTIANLTMSSIIKKISIARGYDPRDFALFCYGGGGPLHGIELARELKIPRVIVPPEPGNFSASGCCLPIRGSTPRGPSCPPRCGDLARLKRSSRS